MSLWERITQRLHRAATPAAAGVLRIPRQMVYGLSRFLDANALLDGEDYPQIEGQFYRMLHGSRGEHIGPSLLGSAAFVGALCDAAYLSPMHAQRQSAHALIDQIAAARGVERQRFELDSLPMCGLDGDIRFVGARGHVYELTIGLGGRPLLRGRGGRMHTAAPHDLDPEQRQLLQRAKLLLGTKLRAQRRRLEHAMLTGQRWDAELFGQMLAHPLLAHHARHLLWAGYDAAGNLIEGFLVQEDGSLVSETYGGADLARYAAVGIPHPADAPLERVLAWSELMDDFRAAPLFLQLHRPISRAADVSASVAASFASARWGASFLFMTLGHMGWDIVVPNQLAEYSLPNLPVRAALDLEVKGMLAMPLGLRFERDGLPLPQEEVPPSLASEVCWHMARLAANPNLIVP